VHVVVPIVKVLKVEQVWLYRLAERLHYLHSIIKERIQGLLVQFEKVFLVRLGHDDNVALVVRTAEHHHYVGILEDNVLLGLDPLAELTLRMEMRMLVPVLDITETRPIDRSQRGKKLLPELVKGFRQNFTSRMNKLTEYLSVTFGLSENKACADKMRNPDRLWKIGMGSGYLDYL